MSEDKAGKTLGWRGEVKAATGSKLRQAAGWLWGHGDVAPRGTVQMIQASLGKLDEDSNLSDEEKKLVNLMFLEDEPNRLNRSGSALTGIGGSLAGATGVPLILSKTYFGSGAEPWDWALLIAVSLGFAFLVVGQFLKLFLIQRESVGPSVAAIVERRDKARTSAEEADGEGDGTQEAT